MLKQVTAILGTQWGDEGKGKMVDYLTPHVDAVVRFQGGHNAGHTLIIDGQKTILRLLPSGILHDHVLSLLGNGMVVSLPDLLGEAQELMGRQIPVLSRIRISEACHVLLPYHVALDQARERAKGQGAIGTTGRGIGPAYEDKHARRGIRMGDCLYPDRLKDKLKAMAEYHNFVLTQYHGAEAIPWEVVYDEVMRHFEQVADRVTDVTALLHQMHADGKRLLCEGAQGAALDVDHGTYPYVTSSSTSAGGIACGTGLGPLALASILGVTKVYTTRVGSGPFPTECHDAIGATMAERGREFGSVTGRPRRCGWFDAVVMKRSVRINSLTGLCLTKLDVLDTLETIKICTGYRYRDQVLTTPPADPVLWEVCQPIYEEHPGWCTSTEGVRQADALPAEATAYIARLSELVGVPVVAVSTSPEREDLITYQV